MDTFGGSVELEVVALFRKKLVQIGLPAILFVVSAGITLVVLQRWRESESAPPSQHRGALESIPGLGEGDLVQLPKLPTLESGEVDLNSAGRSYMLCVFISTECPGCAQDEPFWKALRREISEKQVAFYVIAIDSDRSKVENFAKAYEFEDLPVLFDPQRQVIEAFKISFVPQYVLLGPGGRVMGRWNGIQRYDPKQSNAMDKLKGLLDRVAGPPPLGN